MKVEPMTGGLVEGTRRIGFVLVPEFSMIAFIAALEPLRLANRLAEKQIFSWSLFSEDGGPVTASNDLELAVEGPLPEAGKLDFVFLCSGLNARKYATNPLMGRLRRFGTHGATLGALCTGAFILAKAGLLDAHKCTIHWENMGAFIEDFPEIDVTNELFEIDRKRVTCAGGTAALDMMLSLIAGEAGYSLAATVADQLIHHRIREGRERQRMELRARLGVAHPKLLAAIQRMEEQLEEPLNCSALASEVGISTRQLERLFRKYLGAAPTRYYLELRLQRARYLLQQTSLPVLSVALACGFVSASHFSKCYREYYGHRPSEERGTPLAFQTCQVMPDTEFAETDFSNLG